MNGKPGQFGLWEYEESRDWPIIDKDEARRALAFFGLDCPGPLIWHSARPFSAVVQAHDAGGQDVFLKRHHVALRNRVALREEHDLIAHVRAKGLSVAPPFRSVGEAGVYVEDIWRYECFPVASGHDLYRDRMSWEPYLSEDQAYAAGQALAAFHKASAGYEAPPRSTRPLVSAISPLLGQDPARSLAIWIDSHTGLAEALEESHGWRDVVFSALSPHLDRLKPIVGQLVPLWGHGDWHGSNLLWSQDGTRVLCPFDFGMADRTTRGFDIAIALERSMFGWLTPNAGQFSVHRTQIALFLAGYCNVFSLKAADRNEIAILLPLCHVVFAFSEIWYYRHLLNRKDAVKVAFHDYLIGHTLWFSTPEGQSVLEGIRRPENGAA